jgi:16S rRNA C967 or C1407 C5-methylase (RsmB/RsmF family)
MKPFAAYFDKILIDAPCSGEGMFRKEVDMISHWKPEAVLEYSRMQRELLGQSASMLVPGGTMVYSTCTFSPEENEVQIAAFLDAHGDFEVVDVHGYADFSQGRPDWLRAPWGDGHFAAVLRRQGFAAAEIAAVGVTRSGREVAPLRKGGALAAGRARA